MKILKICLLILCLLPFRAVGMPQFRGANFFMKEIKLFHRKNAKQHIYALVDDEDYDMLSANKWSVHNKKYVGRQLSRIGGIKKQTKILMHRLVMGVLDDLTIHIDHIDGNGFNNQKSNLRKCSHYQNMLNIKSKKNVTSVFKGVRFDKERNKWAAQITYNKGIKKSLGRFDSEILAAIEYDKAAIKFHGEFAKLNFPLK